MTARNFNFILMTLLLLIVHNPIKLFAQKSNVESQYACLMPNRNLSVNTNLLKYVDGIPFLNGSFWNPEEGDSVILKMGGVKASKLFILGGLNSVDLCHPGWGGGNGFENFFFGTKIGEIKIRYVSGQVDVIPLVMGYTSWISYNYKQSQEPFKSDTNMQKMLDNALCIANGLRGYDNLPDTYYFVISLRNEKIEYLELFDNVHKKGFCEINGLSFGGVAASDSAFGRNSLIYPGQIIKDSTQDWINGHTIESSEGYPSFRKDAIEKLRAKFNTQNNDINYQAISEVIPDISADNFKGSKVKFSGSPTALLMTNIFYENSNELLTRVDSDGTVHESSKGADHYEGIGGWTPGLGAYYDDSYTRCRTLTLLSNMGFTSKVNTAVDYFDRWMMYFPNSFPELQLGGKPVPGHATVIANKPLIYFDVLRKVGWLTKYKTHDFGNGENDGHGILMLSRWRTWLKQGKPKAWVDQRWNSIKEAAEYIPWCFANPKLSFSEHGLLYSESEGGMEMESMFCDLNCYLGLLGYIDMAKSTERTRWAERWQKIANAYMDSIKVYYPTTMSPWGDIWDPGKTADWAGGPATLAPVVIGMDYWGYDVANKLPAGWKDRTLRTFKMQVAKTSPAYAASAGIGYGQGFITEAGLLLDQIKDASKMIDWMAKICFAPRLEHPYRVPEGSVIDYDGTIWRRWGDLGNLFQVGEVVYTTQVILGIDDINAKQLTLMPRMPLDWNSIEVTNWPIRSFSKGTTQLFNLSMNIEKNGNDYKVILQSEKAVDKARIRIGPFKLSTKSVNITCNGENIFRKLFVSGDSKWVWVDFGNGQSKSYEINIKAY